MRNIVLVHCISTGINFVEDIINRGYNPIVLELKASETEDGERYSEHVHNEYKMIPYDFDMIYEQDTYEETIEAVKRYDPLLVLPASEQGVVLATRLAYDLGLLGNHIDNLEAMTLKDKMQERIAEYGLRSIRGKVIQTLEEALEFYDEEELNEVVLKPTYSAGSASVRICLNRQEMIDTINNLFEGVNRFGDQIEELLIQEKINGVEYIVNTVSHKGIPRVTMVWKYNKVKTSEGAIVYDSCESVNELGLGEAEMVEYAYDVAKALGIQYGPVHGEYMIDEKGPVLIEVNCRPMGGNMPADFLDRISGQHETDSILDSYLKPERFYEELKKKYELYAYGTLKFFIVPNDLIARSSPMARISTKLEAYHSTSLSSVNMDEIFFPKTKDVETSGGTVFLVHEKLSELEKNLNFLRTVERNAFSLILSEDSHVWEIKDDEAYLNEIMPLLELGEKYGTGLFVTDQFVEGINILQINADQIEDITGKFDFIMVNLNKSLVDKNGDEKVKILLDIFSRLRTGGYIFIPKNNYELSASGRRGTEALLKVLDYRIELPPHNIKDVIIASKTK